MKIRIIHTVAVGVDEHMRKKQLVLFLSKEVEYRVLCDVCGMY